LVILTDIFQF